MWTRTGSGDLVNLSRFDRVVVRRGEDGSGQLGSLVAVKGDGKPVHINEKGKTVEPKEEELMSGPIAEVLKYRDELQARLKATGPSDA